MPNHPHCTRGITVPPYFEAEYIKDSKERMRRRAVQSNIDAAMAQTKQAEESEKLLHATFRTQAMPKTKRGLGALGTTL